mmetsp:Transcript_8962/g.20457  ORF Transcript_8962/g.20457 Transcript_8962/m.20457 type:complete len:238 (-) Transcript_8962:28-741(-)
MGIEPGGHGCRAGSPPPSKHCPQLRVLVLHLRLMLATRPVDKDDDNGNDDVHQHEPSGEHLHGPCFRLHAEHAEEGEDEGQDGHDEGRRSVVPPVNVAVHEPSHRKDGEEAETRNDGQRLHDIAEVLIEDLEGVAPEADEQAEASQGLAEGDEDPEGQAGQAEEGPPDVGEAERQRLVHGVEGEELAQAAEGAGEEPDDGPEDDGGPHDGWRTHGSRVLGCAKGRGFAGSCLEAASR